MSSSAAVCPEPSSSVTYSSIRSAAFRAWSNATAPIVVQGVGGRVDLAFARPDATLPEHLVVIGLKGFDGDAVRRLLQG